jgi:DUF4097 and DUF4098 domain-containing protein YvlB
MDLLIEKYERTRASIKELEEKLDSYKKRIDEIMAEENTEVLKGREYSLSRVMSSREYLSKSDLPPEIWAKYATKCSFPVYRLKKLKR